VDDVLNEQNALELNEEEVHELFEILQNSLNRLLRDSVVLPGTERTGESLGEDQLSSKLKRSGN